MSTTTPNAGYIKPDVGASVDTWGTELNNTLDLVDAHDHTTGTGVRVPVAGLNINADLGLGGFGMTQAKVAAFAQQLASAVTSYARCLFVNSADNELYWRTSGGSNVQITSGTSLNAALLGGFTGDYGTGGSTANYNSGTSIFNFLRAANHRAFLDTSDIRLFQGTAGITNAVKIRSPNTLAASYDFVLPTGLPGVTSHLVITSTGQVQTVSDITLPTNGNVTVSGTGQYKRPGRKWHISAMLGEQTTGTGGNFQSASAQEFGGWTSSAASDVFKIPITVMEGERILSVEGRVNATTGGTVVMRIYRVDTTPLVVPTRTQLGSDATTVGVDDETLTVSGLTEGIGTTQLYYYAEFSFTSVANHRVFGILVTTDVP